MKAFRKIGVLILLGMACVAWVKAGETNARETLSSSNSVSPAKTEIVKGVQPIVIPDNSLGIINVKDFRSFDHAAICAQGDGKTDDTVAIQAAAEIARKQTVGFQPEGGSWLGSSPLLYFPAGHYVISDEIRLGGFANIASDAMAIIEQRGVGKKTFVFHDGFTISIRGIRFLKGSNQIYVDNKNINGTMINIDQCEFQLSSDYAVYTNGTEKEDDYHMSANVMITKCKFMRCRKVLRNVCDYAILRDSWVQIEWQNFDKNSAAFLNICGESGCPVLMFDNVIGVPVFGSRGPKGDNLENGGIDNVRWVDNYGSFLAYKSRFGGEFGGIPIVHHFGIPNAGYPKFGQTVSFQMCWISPGPDARDDSAVITLRKGVPQLVYIVGNSYMIGRPYILNGGLDLDAFLQRYPDAKKRFKIVLGPNDTHPASPSVPEELEPFIVDTVSYVP